MCVCELLCVCVRCVCDVCVCVCMCVCIPVRVFCVAHVCGCFACVCSLCVYLLIHVLHVGAPLFTLAVRVADGTYHWVAFVVTQGKDATCVKRGLQQLKERYPNWNPRAFMLDCDTAERIAISSIFPDAFVSFCDFHVKQAWQRAIASALGKT